MDMSIRSVHLGQATATIINVGDIRAPLTEWMDLPEDRSAPYDTAFFQATQLLAQHCIYALIGGQAVIVDASLEEGKPSLVDQLAGIGVRPEDVGHVVITHAHWDHFNGTTVERDGRLVPVFPNAIHYVGRGDWESPRLQEALQSPDSLESRTLGVLKERGQIESVEGDRELGPGARIVATPGETPGHQAVRFHADGQTLYCVGDLFHHPVEAERLHWMVRWADPATNVPSRQKLTDAAVAENALVVATHIPSIGRLRRSAGGIVWENAG
jgi:glyoxylase-like metal-dependent hydrolase (beta-lactamase superfamily II)